MINLHMSILIMSSIAAEYSLLHLPSFLDGLYYIRSVSKVFFVSGTTVILTHFIVQDESLYTWLVLAFARTGQR